MLRGLSPIFDGWGNFQWNSRSVFATYKQITFFRAGSAAQLTSYHADISLINKQYRKRGHKLHTAAKNSTNNHRPNGQTRLKNFASTCMSKIWSNLQKETLKKMMYLFDSQPCVFIAKCLKMFLESVKLPYNFLALLDEDVFKSNTATPPHFYLFWLQLWIYFMSYQNSSM